MSKRSLVLMLLLGSIAVANTFPLESTLRPVALHTDVRLQGLASIDTLIAQGLERSLFPGAVVLVAQHGEVLTFTAQGASASHGMPEPVSMTTETVFDIASLTKLFTATAVMQLIEQGRVQLDAPIGQYLPEYMTEGREGITVRHLLSHRSGLPAWQPLYRSQPSLEAYLTVSLEQVPGVARVYSDLGYITLGALVEKVSALPLDAYITQFITLPLGMAHTRFNPPADWQERIAATEVQPWTGRQLVWGTVHDENAWALGGVAGHAGLFSTAYDLAIFLQMFLNGGSYDGVRVLEPATIDMMLEPQGLLGWAAGMPFMGGFAAKPTAVGHTGFTGTSVVMDRESGCILVMLTNRVHPSRDGQSIQGWREEAANLVLSVLQDQVAGR